jgi:hypothetical protein
MTGWLPEPITTGPQQVSGMQSAPATSEPVVRRHRPKTVDMSRNASAMRVLSHYKMRVAVKSNMFPGRNVFYPKHLKSEAATFSSEVWIDSSIFSHTI